MEGAPHEKGGRFALSSKNLLELAGAHGQKGIEPGGQRMLVATLALVALARATQPVAL